MSRKRRVPRVSEVRRGQSRLDRRHSDDLKLRRHYALSAVEDQLAAARARLHALDRALAAGEVLEDRRLWGGAGLGIVTALPDSHDTDARYVVTPHAAALSWFVRAIWVGCRPLLDSVTKIEFFGRLGNAAHRCQQRAGGKEDVRDLLGAVVHEAYEVLSDLENGSFFALSVAPGGIVHDDLVDESAHNDGVSSAQIEEWFRMEVHREGRDDG